MEERTGELYRRMTITYNPNDGRFYAVDKSIVIADGFAPQHLSFVELMHYLLIVAEKQESIKS